MGGRRIPLRRRTVSRGTSRPARRNSLKQERASTSAHGQLSGEERVRSASSRLSTDRTALENRGRRTGRTMYSPKVSRSHTTESIRADAHPDASHDLCDVGCSRTDPPCIRPDLSPDAGYTESREIAATVSRDVSSAEPWSCAGMPQFPSSSRTRPCVCGAQWGSARTSLRRHRVLDLVTARDQPVLRPPLIDDGPDARYPAGNNLTQRRRETIREKDAQKHMMFT